MYSIAYVVPFFGKFPKGFQFWLLSCKCNPSIDWLIFTDDKTPYDYPENVKVTYWTFDQMKKKVQAIYDFRFSWSARISSAISSRRMVRFLQTS